MLLKWLQSTFRGRRQQPARRPCALHLEFLEQRCQPAAFTSANQSFVGQAYQDLLQRDVDSDGLTYWSGLLDSGSTREQVVAGIVTSTEYHDLLLNDIYSILLKRAPDSAGLDSWSQFLTQGGTYEQLMADIAGSDEHWQGRAGQTNEGLLSARYQDALYRAMDSSAPT